MDLELTDHAILISTIGALLLLGMATESLGARTRLPRVTLLLLLGILIGPEVLNVLPAIGGSTFELITKVALMMVGFLLGGKLSRKNFARYGKQVLLFSISISITTVAIVAVGLTFIGQETGIALILGAVAVATAPAATSDVIKQTGANGKNTSTLLGIVALDDAWGLILFSIILAITGMLDGGVTGADSILHGLYDLIGAMLIGVVLGVPAAYLTGRIRPGQPTILEALGLVLLCGGLALWAGVSYILASIVLGAVIVNLAKHHQRSFHEIEHFEKPFLVLFFILGGALLKMDSLAAIGIAGSAYIVLRLFGRIGGALLVSRPLEMSAANSVWMGLALLPQAGIALGMALIVSERYPQYSTILLPIVIGSTVIFELLGPVMTYFALARFGEIPKK